MIIVNTHFSSYYTLILNTLLSSLRVTLYPQFLQSIKSFKRDTRGITRSQFPQLLLLKREYFYMYDLDEKMCVWLVKRFKIKSWDQIQKEI